MACGDLGPLTASMPSVSTAISFHQPINLKLLCTIDAQVLDTHDMLATPRKVQEAMSFRREVRTCRICAWRRSELCGATTKLAGRRVPTVAVLGGFRCSGGATSLVAPGSQKL